MTDERFEACLPFILKEEGGYSDDPHDPGGATNLGVIQTEYDKYRKKKGEPTQSVRSITKDEANDIYYNNYWLPTCPKLPAGIDLLYFNAAVNSGPRRATVMLQFCLHINENSDEFAHDKEYVGPVTLKALAGADVHKLAQDMHDYYAEFYKGLSTFQYFGKGWLGRNDRALALAKTMLAQPAQPQEKKVTDTTQPTVTTPATVSVAPLTKAPVNFTDILKQVETILNMVKVALPIVSNFVPQLKPLAVLLPVADEGLAMLEDIQGKSGQDLWDAIGQRIQNIGQQVQSAAPHVASLTAQPAAPTTTTYTPAATNVG